MKGASGRLTSEGRHGCWAVSYYHSVVWRVVVRNEESSLCWIGYDGDRLREVIGENIAVGKRKMGPQRMSLDRLVVVTVVQLLVW